MFNIERPDFCPHCKTQRCIELYDRFDNPIRYTLFLNLFFEKKVTELSKGFYYLKCRNCGVYTDAPLYTSDRLPFMPISNINYKLFLLQYHKDKGDTI
jgi:hypothetical protein